MRLSDRTIEEIKDRLDIEEVVSGYLQLRRKGKRSWACCPFHAEKTPSFSISAERGIYKCFGCGKAGDSIAFVQEMEHVGYVEALQLLGQRYGIKLHYEGHTPGAEDAYKVREGLYALMIYASEHYFKRLYEHEEGKIYGLSYLEERGLKRPVLQTFNIGYALRDGKDLVTEALQHGVAREQMQQAGLLATNGQHDFFSGRILFPIHSPSGQVIAFGGRALGKSKVKYLNSPETTIYHKQKVLYGLYQARKALRATNHAYLVEGYVDVLAMAQAGHENVVAVAGTALGAEQVRLLGRFVDSVTLLFDGDQAGQQATMRAIDLLLEGGLDVFVAPLEDGKDPASCLEKMGKATFDHYLLKNKQSFLTYKRLSLQKQSEDAPFAQSKVISTLLESISRVPSTLTQHLLLRKCSEEVGVPEELLMHTFDKLKSAPAYPAPPKKPQNPKNPQDERAELGLSYVQRHEAEVLRLLLCHGGVTAAADAKYADVACDTVAGFVFFKLNDTPFTHPLYVALADELRKSSAQGQHLSYSDVLAHARADLRDLANELLKEDALSTLRWEDEQTVPPAQCYKLANDAVIRLKRACTQQKLKENLEKLRAISHQPAGSQEESDLLVIHQRLKETDIELSRALASPIFVPGYNS